MILVCCLTSFGVLVSLCFFFRFFSLPVSLCAFPFSLSHYNLLSPLVPSSGNSLNQSLNTGHKIEIDSIKVVMNRCENPLSTKLRLPAKPCAPLLVVPSSWPITRKMFRLAAFFLCMIGVTPPPEVASLGPASGIVLCEQRVIDNKLQNPVGPVLIPAMLSELTTPSQPPKPFGPEPIGLEKVLTHAQADVNHMLHQFQKMTVTQAELSGFIRRPKLFFGDRR